ncbi:MAG: VWA domain-containing protein [Trueperaceae bacterium]|nr:VWA domain-containing protein [Trueperaceae bacterium]
MLNTLRSAAIIATLLLAHAGAITWAQGGPTHVLLVLDASGSMFNRLADGQYRITAAKDAVAGFVSRLPATPGLHVGLRVYGARVAALDDGACEDSELVVPVAGFDREGLLGAVRGTQAKGATPIAYSLELALDDLRDATGRAIVILVTDGIESCGGDVRAAAERLAAAGFELDLRIIGFDLDDLAIRSFEGLGTFENARSVEELAAALGRAVDVAPVAAELPVTVTLTRRGEPASDGATVDFVDPVSGDATRFAARPDGEFVADLPPGSYRAELADAFAASPLVVSGLVVAPEADNAFAFELEPATEVSVEVEPLDPVAGAKVTVRFAGAPSGERSGWLAVAPADAGDEVYLDWSYTSSASGSVELRVPDEAGTLEVRYHLVLPEGGSRVIGRSPAFTSREATATLEAPAEIGAGSQFAVEWTGPDNDRDYLTIVPAGAREGSYDSYQYTRGGSPVTLTAPDAPGAYEVRYVTGQGGSTLASAPVTVTAVGATVSGPPEVPAGSEFAVDWTGPDNDRDYLTIVEAGAREGAYTSYEYTRRGSPVTLTAPIEPGAYELRYVTGRGSATLASAPVTVTAVSASLAAPASVAAGERFEVAWEGPDNPRDYVTIVEAGAREGAYRSYAYTRNGSPATLTAPDEPGAYEVRYVTGTGNRTLASVAISVR